MAAITLPDTVHGGSITVQASNLADAQQKAADATGASLSQQQGGGTFGANSNAPTGGGGGGGGSSAPVAPDLAGYVAAMQASSGLSIKDLEEKKREFDADLAFKQQQWREQGLPELAIKQRAQDLEEAKFKELTDQAHFTQNLQTRAQTLQEQVQLGQLGIAEATAQLAREVQTGQLRVAQGQLGLDTLKTGASLSGPENWIQAANFNRGVAANAMLPGFVSDLLTGRSTATMAGPAAGAQMSQPLTLTGMAANMGANLSAAPQQATGVQPQPTAQVAPQAAPQGGGAATIDQFRQLNPADQATYIKYNGGTEAGGFAKWAADANAAAQAAGAAAQSQQLDAAHMGQFYASALAAAGGTPTTSQGTGAGTGATGDSGSQMATAGDVASAFGRAPTADQQLDPSVAALQKVFQQGGAALGPQQLEGLSPTESKMFQGGGAAIGADVPGYISAYQRSRIGQTAVQPAMAA